MLSAIKQFFKNNSVKIFWLLVFCLSIWTAWQNKNRLFFKTDMKAVSEKYAQSQYVLGDAAEHWIRDDTVYKHAAAEYLQGKNPTRVNFEHPPLGKYFLSLSLLLFDNPVTIEIAFYILVLILFHSLAKKILHNDFLTLTSTLIFGSTQILRAHVGEGLLDLQMLVWTLAFFNLLFWKTKKAFLKFSLIGIVLGALAATKYFFPLLSLYLFSFAIYWFFEKRRLVDLFTAAIFLILIYLGSYLAFFIKGNDLMDLIRFELYRFNWWTGNRDFPKFLFLASVFLGRFKAWWADNTYEYAAHWSVLWPIFAGYHFIAAWLIKWNLQKIIVFIFSSLFLLMLALGGANNSRYALQLLPFWIMFSLASLPKIHDMIIK